ncbi:transcriptional regulator [Vibrio neptunius]|uniref:winged helix-turn-helix transcriptional regulator n=1 Tax=Vibrio neptunius TaxID=170651 RepID=UPI0005FA58B9|nr:helix-turn-helix domain-containing protein [Vibrio neptunius]KJY90290.1 transcriptional regulator [Vibrio neptunius]
MTNKIQDNDSGPCPVEMAVGLIGGKWKPTILFHLSKGSQRYSELQRLIPNASDRMLTRSLRELEECELVLRTVFAEVPARVEYSLLPDAETLVPILESISNWGKNRTRSV